MSNLISIIMPAYNASNTISESIQSVLDQTYQDFELIVVNDCSSDNTKEIVIHFLESDDRIKFIDKKINEGVAYARNAGLDCAEGEFVAFLDSDDVWCKNKLEKQIKLLIENIGVDITYTEYFRFNGKGLKQKVDIPTGYTDYNTLLKGDFIGNSSALYRFRRFSEVRQKKVGAEDYLFWLEIFNNHNVKGLGIKEPLMYYRVDENQGSLSGNKFKSASWVWNIYFKYLRLGFFSSLYYFSNYVIRALFKRV